MAPEADEILTIRPCRAFIMPRNTPRDNFMTADAAKEFGLIDEVIEKRPEPAAA